MLHFFFFKMKIPDMRSLWAMITVFLDQNVLFLSFSHVSFTSNTIWDDIFFLLLSFILSLSLFLPTHSKWKLFHISTSMDGTFFCFYVLDDSSDNILRNIFLTHPCVSDIVLSLYVILVCITDTHTHTLIYIIYTSCVKEHGTFFLMNLCFFSNFLVNFFESESNW